MDSIKKKMLERLSDRMGNISKACTDCNIGRSTHYLWLESDAEYKAEVESLTEGLIDHVEDKLIEKINGVSIAKGVDDDGKPIVYDVPPSDTAIIFFLKTRAKKRGYIEKVQTELSGQEEIGVTFNGETKDLKTSE